MPSLTTNRPQRVHFNPKDKKHLESLKTFLSTGQWGEVKFAVEGSYLSVPDYVLRKYATHVLKCRDCVLDPVELPAPAPTSAPKVITNVRPLLQKVA